MKKRHSNLIAIVVILAGVYFLSRNSKYYDIEKKNAFLEENSTNFYSNDLIESFDFVASSDNQIPQKNDLPDLNANKKISDLADISDIKIIENTPDLLDNIIENEILSDEKNLKITEKASANVLTQNTITEEKQISQNNDLKHDNLSPGQEKKVIQNYQVEDQKIIGDIFIYDNKYTNSDFIKKSLHVKKNDPLDLKLLNKHLYFLNLNPFRKIDLYLLKKDSEYDLNFLVDDRFPLRVYSEADNTGLKLLDRNRVSFGFDWNKAFFINSILSYQYLASYDFKKFQSHTLNWTFFLPWENLIKIFGNYSQIEIDHQIPMIIKTAGFSSQLSFRYDVILPMIKNILHHDIILGFDFKRTDTNLLFSRFLATNDIPVNLTQFLLSYKLSSYFNICETDLILELYSSFGQLIPDEQNYRYRVYRSFAKNRYVYGKGFLSNLFYLPKDFLFSLMLTAQLANENLLPSETLGIGGYNTVRGYYEREINTDSGVIVNAEIRSPSASFLPGKRDSFQLLAFLDYGLGSLHTAKSFEEKTKYLLSCGPGIRYSINTYLAARLDWGIRIKNSEIPSQEKSLLHFSVNLSY
ncbi:MAG: ShlB/FhaC/HecB family hemolysin secretion/activation protein [Parachlamydiales bacterium]|jgi:hemolysin activation/secretion protein